MAQCAGPTKPGLFLARYLANHNNESPSYRKLLDDRACLFAHLLACLLKLMALLSIINQATLDLAVYVS